MSDDLPPVIESLYSDETSARGEKNRRWGGISRVGPALAGFALVDRGVRGKDEGKVSATSPFWWYFVKIQVESCDN